MTRPQPITQTQDTRLNELRQRGLDSLPAREQAEYISLCKLVAANLRYRWTRNASVNFEPA